MFEQLIGSELGLRAGGSADKVKTGFLPVGLLDDVGETVQHTFSNMESSIIAVTWIKEKTRRRLHGLAPLPY